MLDWENWPRWMIRLVTRDRIVREAVMARRSGDKEKWDAMHSQMRPWERRAAYYQSGGAAGKR